MINNGSVNKKVVKFFHNSPTLALRNLLPILWSMPIALATSSTSAPVASHRALMLLMLLIRWARNALAACSHVHTYIQTHSVQMTHGHIWLFFFIYILKMQFILYLFFVFIVCFLQICWWKSVKYLKAHILHSPVWTAQRTMCWWWWFWI